MAGTSRYSAEEKLQLLANFDLEVSYRIGEFEDHLSHVLANFRSHHEGQVLRIPKLVRGVTMAEFGDKYNGDIQACLRGLQKARAGGEPIAIDASVRKRKWQDSVEETHSQTHSDAESTRSKKTARTTVSPIKRPIPKPPGTPRGLPRVPATPSPTKPFRPTSPTKSSTLGQNRLNGKLPAHPPSSMFNSLSGKSNTIPRKPRKNESLLSVNGSPLAPYEHDDADVKGARGMPDAFRTARPNGAAPLRPVTPSRPSHQHHKSQSSISSLLSFPSIPNFTFDPLQNSPKMLDKALAASDLPETEKKKYKEDVVRKIREAMDKWTL